MRGLAEARLFRPLTRATTARPLADRPAELFARGTDWFVASALAAAGPDEWISVGHRRRHDRGLRRGAADGDRRFRRRRSLSAIHGSDRRTPRLGASAFESQWSDPRRVDPVLLVRRVLETPVSWRAVWQAGTGASGSAPAVRVVGLRRRRLARARARESLLMLAVDAPRSRHGGSSRAIPARERAKRMGEQPARRRSVVAGGRRAADRRVARGDRLGSWRPRYRVRACVPVVPAIFRSSAVNCSSIAR